MINKDDKVVIVDDLLATGGNFETLLRDVWSGFDAMHLGTAEAACKLVKHLEGEIVECAFIIELKDLGGRAKAPEGVKYFSLITY
jgi:adenine phosphoribosyltransferase